MLAQETLFNFEFLQSEYNLGKGKASERQIIVQFCCGAPTNVRARAIYVTCPYVLFYNSISIYQILKIKTYSKIYDLHLIYTIGGINCLDKLWTHTIFH